MWAILIGLQTSLFFFLFFSLLKIWSDIHRKTWQGSVKTTRQKNQIKKAINENATHPSAKWWKWNLWKVDCGHRDGYTPTHTLIIGIQLAFSNRATAEDAWLHVCQKKVSGSQEDTFRLWCINPKAERKTFYQEGNNHNKVEHLRNRQILWNSSCFHGKNGNPRRGLLSNNGLAWMIGQKEPIFFLVWI